METNTVKRLFIFLTLFSFLIVCFPPTASAEKLPSPEDFFGFEVGADYHLLSYGRAVEYWRKLEELSGRIKLFEYGQTSEGRPMLLAAVSSEDNLTHLTHYKEISKQLSLVRGLSEEEARRLSSTGKAIVWIDGGLHATEVAPAQHIIQLTHDLLTDESQKIKKIREALSKNPNGLWVREISRQIGLNRTTVSIYLSNYMHNEIDELFPVKGGLIKIVRLKK